MLNIATATVAERKTDAQKVADDLRSVGMEVADPNPSSFGKRIFVIGTDRGRALKIWPGDAELTISKSEDHRQAVIRVLEKDRTIGRDIKVRAQIGTTLQDIRRTALDRWTDIFPEGTKQEAGKPKLVDRKRRTYLVPLVAKVKASDQTFLTGIDETAHFVAAMPDGVHPKTVEEAHAYLKPKGLPEEGVKRQGEWFFIPVTDAKLRKRLNRALSRRAHRHPEAIKFDKLEQGSTHMVTPLITLDDRMFCNGVVKDNRKGRHAPLILKKWHEIKRNRERKADFAPRAQRRYWD